MIKRRVFLLVWATLGVIISKWLHQLPSFAQNNPESFLGYHPVGTIDELKSRGFLLTEELEIGAVLVRLTNDNQIIAVDPTCTHAGCLVEWNEQENVLICPCHSSKFQATGELIEGLAPIDLTKYQVKTDQNLVFVALDNEY